MVSGIGSLVSFSWDGVKMGVGTVRAACQHISKFLLVAEDWLPGKGVGLP